MDQEIITLLMGELEGPIEIGMVARQRMAKLGPGAAQLVIGEIPAHLDAVTRQRRVAAPPQPFRAGLGIVHEVEQRLLVIAFEMDRLESRQRIAQQEMDEALGAGAAIEIVAEIYGQ